jgi:cobalt-zinc-cadmium efflux system membrane fusion protein
LTPEAIERHGVAVGPAESQKVSRPIIAPAWVDFNPEAVAQVGTVVEGRVAKIHVGLGSQVKIGDALFDIDSSELGRAQSEFLQKRAGVAVARSGVAVAEKAHQRAVSLSADNAIPAAEVQRRESDLLRVQTEVMAAEADLQAAENSLILLGMDQAEREELARVGRISPRLTVRAPLDGWITARAITVGQVIGPDSDNLMTVADPHDVWVIANVPESQAGLVTVGTVALVTGPLLGDQTLKATVSFISPTVDASTRSVQVRLSVTGDSGLRPGAFVQVELRPQASTGSVVVPREAIFSLDSTSTVFIPGDGPNRFIAREVEVGPAIGDQMPIISGLKPGDLVVMKGGFIIKADLGKAGAKGCCDFD